MPANTTEITLFRRFADAMEHLSKFSRPTSLQSNRLDALDASEVEAFLRTPDSSLGTEHYTYLFFPEPAGAYEELAYFLPLAVDFARKRPEEAQEFIGGVVHFVALFNNRLRDDELLPLAYRLLNGLLSVWTQSFVPLPLMTDKLLNHPPYAGVCLAVTNSESIMEYLNAVTEHEAIVDTHAIATSVLRDWRRCWSRAAWLMEYISAIVDGRCASGLWNVQLVKNCDWNQLIELSEVHLPSSCAEAYAAKWRAAIDSAARLLH